MCPGNRSAQCFANTDDVTSVLGKQCLGHSSCTIKPYRDYLEKIALSGGDPCPSELGITIIRL